MSGNSSFILPTAIIGIAFAAFISICFVMVMNGFVDIYNDRVDEGRVSEYTSNYITLSKSLYSILFLVAFIGIFVWVKSNIGLESYTVDIFRLYTNLIGMYVLGFVSFIFVWVYGMMWDEIILFGMGDIMDEIATTPGPSTIGVIGTIGYGACLLPAIFGMVLFCLNCVNKTFGDIFGRREQNYSSDVGYIGNGD